MRRRIVQQGPTTLMVSLPIKWVRKYGLSKGEEIDLEEKGNKLLIATEKKTKEEKTEITLDIADKVYIWRSLQQVYLLGYDEIKINFNSPKILDIIQDVVISSLIGFEITSQDKTSCVMRAVSTELNKQFDILLRRTFLNIIQMSEILQRFLEKKESPLQVLNLEIMNNRHTMFLRRILLKEGYERQEKVPSLYALIVLLEKIANEFKYLVWHIRDDKITISKQIISAYKRIQEEIRNVYETFYSFDNKKMKDIVINDVRVEEMKHLLNQEPELIHYFMNITSFIRSCLFQIMLIAPS